jgi:YfiR/HmsC-like
MSMRSACDAENRDPTLLAPAAHPLTKTRTLRYVAWLTILVCLLFAGIRERSGAQSMDEEYRVKAAFIFHFAQLVDWPPETRTGAGNSLFLCTIGDDPFQGALESTVAGKAVGDRILRVRHLKLADDMQACHILFLGKAQSKHISALLADLHNAPILTVGEGLGFLAAGGMICFVLEDNNVRFGINLDAAASAKLKIGSRLLILAQTVIGESREK